MKRYAMLVCLLLSFVFLLIFLPDPRTEAQSSVPAGWTGIYDRAGLTQISSNPGGKYILMNDIDLSGAPWSALCSEDAPFTGTFDGNGHTVYGMSVSHSVSACGLFSYVCGGTVQSLTVSGSSSGPIAGILAGKVSQGTVKNCTVSGTVSSSYFGGGIAGQISGSSVTVSGCRSGATVSGNGVAGSELLLGGVCGAVYGTGHVFSGDSFTGKLIPSGPAVSAGGVAGAAQGGVTFADCNSEGTLTLSFTDSATVGGIAGRAGDGEASFLRCSFRGDWSGSDCSGVLYLGGICGRIAAYAPVSVYQCTAYGSLAGAGHGNFLKVSDRYECITCDAPLSSASVSSYVGGIAGAAISFQNGVSLAQCASYTDLSATGGAVALGGIVGINRAEGSSAAVHDCYSAGSITYNTAVWGDLFSPIGGIAGSNGGKGTAQVRQCVSFCEMNVAYPLIDGAVVGFNGGDADASGSATVTQCYYRAGEREFFATPLSGAQLTDPASYKGLDFASVWKTDANSGLPILRISEGVASCPKGDVDGNGVITRYDGVLLTQYLTGNAQLTGAQLQRADLSGDGVLNARDVTLILRSVQ